MGRPNIKATALIVGATLVYFGSISLSVAQTTTYSYDVFGRLSAVSTAGGAQTSYAYDAADNRAQVAKTSGVQVIGAARQKKNRQWLQFALGRKRPAAAVNSATASLAVAPARPAREAPASSAQAGSIALATAGAGR